MVYALAFEVVYGLMLLGVILWTFLGSITKGQEKCWKIFNMFLCIVALYLVLRYTVFYRMPSHKHEYIFFAPYSGEFYREMLMNMFLFYPLGLTLTVLIGPWSILAAFALSFGIESWQYAAGTGVAQGSDVIMNTLGSVIGTAPYLSKVLWKKFRVGK